MQRIQTATKAPDLFGAGKDGFKDGNLAGGVAPTDLNAAWFNQVQEELSALVEGAGLALDGTLTQVKQAIDIMIRRGAGRFCVAAGTVDAITGDFTPDVAALVNGMTVVVRAAGANATATPTFKADGTVAKTIVKEANQALLPGDIPGAGFWAVLVYDATLDKWVLTNPAAKLGTGYMLVRDEKATGTAGGTNVTGVQQRVLNTVAANTILGASLASNQVTLPAGKYRIRALAPSSGNVHRAHLYNVTDAAVAILGTSENSSIGASSDPINTLSIIEGTITIAAAKVFEVRHYMNEVKTTTGLGSAVSDTFTEVYTVLEITKE